MKLKLKHLGVAEVKEPKVVFVSILMGNSQLMSQRLFSHYLSNTPLADACLEIIYDLQFI